MYSVSSDVCSAYGDIYSVSGNTFASNASSAIWSDSSTVFEIGDDDSYFVGLEQNQLQVNTPGLNDYAQTDEIIGRHAEALRQLKVHCVDESKFFQDNSNSVEHKENNGNAMSKVNAYTSQDKSKLIPKINKMRRRSRGRLSNEISVKVAEIYEKHIKAKLAEQSNPGESNSNQNFETFIPLLKLRKKAVSSKPKQKNNDTSSLNDMDDSSVYMARTHITPVYDNDNLVQIKRSNDFNNINIVALPNQLFNSSNNSVSSVTSGANHGSKLLASQDIDALHRFRSNRKHKAKTKRQLILFEINQKYNKMVAEEGAQEGPAERKQKPFVNIASGPRREYLRQRSPTTGVKARDGADRKPRPPTKERSPANNYSKRKASIIVTTDRPISPLSMGSLEDDFNADEGADAAPKQLQFVTWPLSPQSKSYLLPSGSPNPTHAAEQGASCPVEGATEECIIRDGSSAGSGVGHHGGRDDSVTSDNAGEQRAMELRLSLQEAGVAGHHYLRERRHVRTLCAVERLIPLLIRTAFIRTCHVRSPDTSAPERVCVCV